MTTPSADNYVLGKGVVYFNMKDPITGLYTGERDLGNAPAFSLNVSTEKLEHYSSRGGLKAKDKQVILLLHRLLVLLLMRLLLLILENVLLLQSVVLVLLLFRMVL